MATAPATLSIAEYLRTSYRPDADFVDGELEERNAGEFEHGYLQLNLGALFLLNQKNWNVRPVTEQRIRVTEDRVRVADLAILRADAPREPVTITPPLICIEVMSPEDRLNRAERVLADYWQMGVKNLWLFDPIRRIAYTFEGELHLVRTPALTVPGTEIRVDLETIFSVLD